MNIRKLNLSLFVHHTTFTLISLPSQVREVISEFVPLCENPDCFHHIAGAQNYCSYCDLFWSNGCSDVCKECGERRCVGGNHDGIWAFECEFGCGSKICFSNERKPFCGVECPCCDRLACQSCATEYFTRCDCHDLACEKCTFECSKCHDTMCDRDAKDSVFNENILCLTCFREELELYQKQKVHEKEVLDSDLDS
jgi:hypothetical protein